MTSQCHYSLGGVSGPKTVVRAGSRVSDPVAGKSRDTNEREKSIKCAFPGSVGWSFFRRVCVWPVVALLDLKIPELPVKCDPPLL